MRKKHAKEIRAGIVQARTTIRNYEQYTTLYLASEAKFIELAYTGFAGLAEEQRVPHPDGVFTVLTGYPFGELYLRGQMHYIKSKGYDVHNGKIYWKVTE